MFRKSPQALVLAFLLVPTLLGSESPAEATLQFTNYVQLAPFDHATVADFNADGLLDIFGAARAITHFNLGTNFTAAHPYEGSTFGLTAVAADFDGDNAIDLYNGWPIFRSGSVISNHFAISWNGAGRNTNIVSPFTPAILGGAAAADFDNDGDLDLLVTGNTNSDPFRSFAGLTRLYENVGSREFVAHSAPFPSFERGLVSWADYDTDGDMDLLLAGVTNANGTAATILYRNDDLVFTNSGVRFPKLAEGSASWGDYDGDNDLDLLLSGNTNTIRSPWPHAAIYRNDGTNFTAISFGATNLARIILSAWADFDIDGDLDILASQSYSSAIRRYTNEGDDTFVPTNHLTSGGYLIPADLNNDGVLDYVAHNLDSSIRTVRSIYSRSNTPPSAPTNLSSAPASGAVSLSWNSATDSEQPVGLTYNLRIGTAPGRSDIMSAMANLTNGTLLVPRQGNTGLRTNWTIKNFSLGTYYWSVQAIDTGLAASTFAPEQSFTITEAPPFGRMLSFANVSPVGALIDFRINPNGSATSYYLEYISSNATATTTARQLEPTTTNIVLRLPLSGLEPGTRYEVRFVASNSFGIHRSSPASFTTAPSTVLTEFPAPFPILTRHAGFHPVDFDQDGDLDVVTSGAYPAFVMTNKVFLNDRGVFHESGSIPNPPFISTAGWLMHSADFNNDGLLDWIVADDFQFGMLTQTNNRTFEARRMTEIMNPYFARIGDADNDGDIDLATAVPSPLNTVGLFANDNIPRLRLTSTRYGGGQFLEWADYDADGDNDALISGSTNNNQSIPNYAVTRIFPSDGANILPHAHTNLPGALWGASWDDYDNDGDLDIALVQVTNFLSNSTNHLRLFRNDGTNGFVDAGRIASDRAISYLQWIDFNRDGLKDIFLIQDLDHADRLRLFLNAGIEEFSGQFSEFDLGLPPLTNAQAKFADIDGDLMPDLLVSAMATNLSQRVRIFRNNLISTNPAPPVLTSLTSIVARSSATLHWQHPHPIHDINRIAYTFNLRIGTTPGGSEIMSAISHPLTGARYLPQRGNAGQSGTWLIRDLPPGTYYWSVQSVDHAFNASPFSEESTFTIAPHERAPQILAINIGTNGLPQLTIDGPTRSRAQIHRSLDLLNWIPATGYTYIPGDPATVPIPTSESRFYRFLLLE